MSQDSTQQVSTPDGPMAIYDVQPATPWLGLFGDADTGIPVADVEQLRATLDRETRVAHEIVRYPGAEHGFHCDVRASYDAAAASDAWQRTLDWLGQHLAP